MDEMSGAAVCRSCYHESRLGDGQLERNGKQERSRSRNDPIDVTRYLGMKSLIVTYKQVILDELRLVQPQNKWKVVILDRPSRKLIEYVMPLSEFYDENVTDVQMIENVREPNTSFEAVYFLSARPESVKCLLYDFRKGSETYAAAHLFFLNAADDALVNKVGSIGSHVRSLRELYLDFTPVESQVFTTHDPDCALMLFAPSCGASVELLIKEMAMKIVCLCILLGEYPIIRYHRPLQAQHAARILSTKLAHTVQTELDNHARNNEAFPPKSDRPRGVLLITDRSMDLYAPLVHEFTFQAMANDLLPIRDGCFYEFVVDSGKGRETVQEVISEKDAAWLSVRHMHMSLAIDQLVQEFNKFTKDNAAFSDQEKATNLNVIRNMLAGMDSYAQGKDKYSLYINMAQECMSKFEQMNLPGTGQVEQNCSTGVTSLGKTPKDVLETMVPLLDDERVPQEDRVRLLMIYLVFKQGIFPDDRSKLLKHAKISSALQEAVMNLDLLGIPATKTQRNRRSKHAHRKSGPVTVDEAFELSRFTPSLKQVIEGHLNGSLDPEEFPFTRDMPPEPETRPNNAQGSLRTNRPAWAKGRTQLDVPRQRIIAFVAGGATYSEIRATYEISESHNRDMVLGATNIITPKMFLGMMSVLRRQRPELGLAMDAPPAPIPLLEQRPPAAPQQQSAPQKKKSTPSKEPPQAVQTVVDSGARTDEKQKKKFGLFGKKK